MLSALQLPRQPSPLLSTLRIFSNPIEKLGVLKMMSSKFSRPALAAVRRTVPRTAIRTYAAPAADNTRPPVALYGLDGTYANALVCPQSEV